MAAKSVTQEDVFNAARELVAAGEKPSIIAIHKRIGRGSNTTIAKYRAQFLESDEMKDLQVANLPPVAELPEEFEEEGSHFVKKIWQAAKSVSDAQLEAERQALAAKHETMQQEVTEAVDFADSVANERDEYQEKSEAQALEIEQSKSEITELKHALELAEQKIQGLTADLEKASADAIESKENIASAISDTAALKQEITGLNSRLAETKDSHEIEISRLLKQAESDKNQAIKQCEKTHEQVVVHHNDRISSMETAHDKAVKQLIEQHNKTEKQLENVISDTRQQRDQFQKEAAKLRAEAKKPAPKKSAAKKTS